MARDDAPPFARGETWYNGGPIDPTSDATLGGVNIEGKEFIFEANSQDNFTNSYSNASMDPCGRQIHVKVVRNASGVNLLPSRVAHYQATDHPYETRIDGYCYNLADRPAGIVDEFLPAAGVAPNDLFYVVVKGPSRVTQPHVSPAALLCGSVIVPTNFGTPASVTDPLGGRIALQDLTGSGAVLGNNLQNRIGYVSTPNASVIDASLNMIVHLGCV